MRFFFYGTLLDQAVRSAVLGKYAARLTVEPACLPGWRRVHMKGRSYPVVILDPKYQVEGCLTSELPAAALASLDGFEGSEYRRSSLDVIIESGDRISAYVYVARAHHMASARAWHYDDWVRRDRVRYLRRI